MGLLKGQLTRQDTQDIASYLKKSGKHDSDDDDDDDDPDDHE